jgi:Ni/Co efflux regulator RcnB
MRRTALLSSGCAALMILGMLAAAPARAEMSDHPGGGPIEKHERGPESEHPTDRGRDERGGHEERGGHNERERPHFAERDRVTVHEYYGEEIRRGHCPPGLAKKRNGCVPPGQARKWAIGRPLPRDVIFYDVPPQLVIRLSPPPRGYRYVRVASDILLIAVGTGLVIDAIRDLGGI